MPRTRPSLLAGSPLLSLAFAGGALDATSYLGLGQVFTGNMTGNTVLLVAGLAHGTGAHPLRCAAALGGFIAGAFASAFVVPPSERPWPAKAQRGLQLELLALIGLLIAWTACGVRPIRFELIAAGGVAMGMQSAVAFSSDFNGVNTTYITGTLMTALARAARRARPHTGRVKGPGLPGSAWITYGAGALAGAFAVAAWHSAAVLLPTAVVAAVCLCARRQHQQEEGSDDGNAPAAGGRRDPGGAGRQP